MIGYVTLGTNDMERASAFFDALFAEVGIARQFEMGRFIGWGHSIQGPLILLCTPFNEQSATPGNGCMVGVALPDTDAVGRFHAKALSLGAQDEGPPGVRFGNFYAAYIRDLDGNKMSGFCYLPEDTDGQKPD